MPVVPENQAAIEAEEEEKRVLKLKNRAEMEKMLAANQDLHQRRAERISEEQAVSFEQKLPTATYIHTTTAKQTTTSFYEEPRKEVIYFVNREINHFRNYPCASHRRRRKGIDYTASNRTYITSAPNRTPHESTSLKRQDRRGFSVRNI